MVMKAGTIFLHCEMHAPAPVVSTKLQGKKTLDPSSIAKDIHALSCEYVGNYAIRIRWSDGHDTGLYNFKLLRERG